MAALRLPLVPRATLRPRTQEVPGATTAEPTLSSSAVPLLLPVASARSGRSEDKFCTQGSVPGRRRREREKEFKTRPKLRSQLPVAPEGSPQFSVLQLPGQQHRWLAAPPIPGLLRPPPCPPASSNGISASTRNDASKKNSTNTSRRRLASSSLSAGSVGSASTALGVPPVHPREEALAPADGGEEPFVWRAALVPETEAEAEALLQDLVEVRLFVAAWHTFTLSTPRQRNTAGAFFCV